MDHETWIITPITWTLVLTVVGFPLLLLSAGIDGAIGFMYNNMKIICYIILAISAILLVIPLFSGVHIVSVLAFFAGIIPISQLLYMFCQGVEAIYIMPYDISNFLWRLVAFVVWFIYILINLIISLGSLVLGIVSSFSYKSTRHSSSDAPDIWFLLGTSSGITAVVGVIGWGINWIFL